MTKEEESFQRPAQVEERPAGFDPGYLQWRAAQLRELDDDYRLWRQGGHVGFSEDFVRWRCDRQAQAGADRASGQADDAASGGVIAAGPASRGG